MKKPSMVEGWWFNKICFGLGGRSAKLFYQPRAATLFSFTFEGVRRSLLARVPRDTF